MTAKRGRRLARLGLGLLAVTGCSAPVPGELGAREGRLAPCPSSPNCVSTQAPDEVHGTDPFLLALPPEQAWSRVREAVETLDGAAVVQQTDDYLHAECTTPLMRYVDDLELLLLPEQGRIAVRSASRVGWSDIGANRERIWQLRGALQERGVIR